MSHWFLPCDNPRTPGEIHQWRTRKFTWKTDTLYYAEVFAPSVDVEFDQDRPRHRKESFHWAQTGSSGLELSMLNFCRFLQSLRPYSQILPFTHSWLVWITPASEGGLGKPGVAIGSTWTVVGPKIYFFLASTVFKILTNYKTKRFLYYIILALLKS